MKRDDLISKGYTEEQVTELLTLFHDEQSGIKNDNEKLKKTLEEANNKITELDKIQKAYKEKEKSQMSEQEKFEEMKREMEQHLANSKMIENRAYAKTIMAEIGGVDDEVLNTLVSSDLDKTEANAKALVNLIKAREEASVKKTKQDLLTKNVLPTGNSNVTKEGQQEMTKEDFKKLSISEKSKIFRENKELWNKMTQE